MEDSSSGKYPEVRRLWRRVQVATLPANPKTVPAAPPSPPQPHDPDTGDEEGDHAEAEAARAEEAPRRARTSLATATQSRLAAWLSCRRGKGADEDLQPRVPAARPIPWLLRADYCLAQLLLRA